MQAWIRGIDSTVGSRIEAASDDASFRRYFRLDTGSESFVAMDAPPEKENSAAFIRIAAYLEAMQLNAPRVIEANLEDGFLLLTDLGRQQYLDVLNADSSRAGRLYTDAIDALIALQRHGAAYQGSLPPYDEDLLRFELSLFRDWLCETHGGLSFSDADEAAWGALCDVLVDNALAQPRVFVHRDYHSRNLMFVDADNPGILDFQDALEGPFTYDLVSLLKDCYIRWPEQQVHDWAMAFYERSGVARRSGLSEARFMRYFDLTGVQRHLKAAGIFCRLQHRDGKARYLKDVPRTLAYVAGLAVRYDELQWIAGLISHRILPEWSGSP